MPNDVMFCREAAHVVQRELGAAPRIQGPVDAARLLREHANVSSLKEHFWVLLLDGRHRCLWLETISVGTLTASLVHPREVFRLAVRESAAAILTAHNHPSGQVSPSLEDKSVHERLEKAGELLGIPLLDSLIVTPVKLWSTKEGLARVY